MSFSIIGRGSFAVQNWVLENRYELVKEGYKITDGYLGISISPASHIIRLKHKITGEKQLNGIIDIRIINRDWVIDYHETELMYRKWEADGKDYREKLPSEGYQYDY